jgi:very-short-patch-repair endonuclease
VRRRKPPHPDAARPPSPARGEGYAEIGADALPKGKLVSIGARSRWAKRSPSGTAEPSPLAGEGGERRSRSPGEGASPSPKVKRQRPATGLSNAELRSHERTANTRQLRNVMTDAERKLWSLLRNRKLLGCKFRRQFPVGRYVVDYICLETRLIIEADGGQHADSTHDLERDAWLQAQGFRILRLWNSDILANPEGVLARIFAILSKIPADAAPIAEATT